MTVETETSRSGPYAGAGTTGPFTVGFRFLAETHLQVVQTDADSIDTTLAYPADYSVAGVGASSGTVTLTIPLPVGETLTIIRDVPFTQNADYVDNDSFPAESHEEALDLLTMQTQQLKGDATRALRLSVADEPQVIGPLPLKDARVNKFLSFDVDGNPVATVFDLDTIQDASDTAVAAAADASASAAAADASADAAAASEANVTNVADSITPTYQQFSGDGVTLSFTMDTAPPSEDLIDVFVGGVYQPKSEYSVVGFDLIFTGAPPVGTDNIEVRMSGTVAFVLSADEDWGLVTEVATSDDDYGALT